MKRRFVAASILLGVAPLMSSCVAAAIPVVAGGMIAKKRVDGHPGHKRKKEPDARTGADTSDIRLATLTSLPPPDGSVAATAPVSGIASEPSVPPGMQFLYGSGEAEALSIQAFLNLADLMIAKSTDRKVGIPIWSVSLASGSTLAAPKYVPCGRKPLAVVFDIDETVLLNLGYEADDSQRHAPYDQARWNRWEQTGQDAVAATPGMAEVASVARTTGVTMVFNSNRMAANAPQTEAMLTGAGLGPVAHGRNLWLQGDEGPGTGKDARRAAIAQRFCVIAMAGDQLGDFSDQFNAPSLTPADRRALAGEPKVRILWGHGWFILPNPVYGTALKGKIDDIFPAGKRWTDPGPTSIPTPPAATPAPTGAQ